MNQLAVALDNDENVTVTGNGMPVRRSTFKPALDLFNAFGASRSKIGYYDKSQKAPITELFQKAMYDDLDVAVRVALYGRDAREGMGERQAFRDSMRELALRDSESAEKIVSLVPELGRFDDLMAFFNTPAEDAALSVWVSALRDGNGLAAKWAPREKSAKRKEANKLRRALGMTSRNYRKMLADLSDTVEDKMCANAWSDIDYSKVPSVAAARYQKAFSSHDEEGYAEYRNALVKGETKINAGAVYPYDIVRSARNGDKVIADEQWKALPDFIESDKSFIPLIDVSASMDCRVSGSITAMDVAVSLGIYVAQRSKCEAFKNRFLTFQSDPNWVSIEGLSFTKAMEKTLRAEWGGSTNFTAAYRKILNVAKRNKVPQEDMPEYLIVFSDMQFDHARGEYMWDRSVSDNFVMDDIRREFEEAGYRAPKMVFWNLNDYGTNTHAEANDQDVALVSGFSASMMKTVLADVEQYTPLNVMLNAVMQERYNWQ